MQGQKILKPIQCGRNEEHADHGSVICVFNHRELKDKQISLCASDLCRTIDKGQTKRLHYG